MQREDLKFKVEQPKIHILEQKKKKRRRRKSIVPKYSSQRDRKTIKINEEKYNEGNIKDKSNRVESHREI